MIPIPPELAVADEPFDLDTLDLTIAVDRQELADHVVLPSDRGEDLQTAHAEIEAVRRWHVEDDGAAEWAMRHLAAIDRERAAIAEQANLWYERIREWEGAEFDRLSPRAKFFVNRLSEYALRVRADDPKRATISLPSGKISTRAAKAPTVEIEDEEAVLKWASGALTDEEYEQVVKVTTKVLISEIRARVTVDEVERTEQAGPDDATLAWVDRRVVWKATGEVVPGLAAYVSETTATVTPAQ